MMSAVYQPILHPILALKGYLEISAKVMGFGSLVRRLLRVILDSGGYHRPGYLLPRKNSNAQLLTAPTMWMYISGKIRRGASTRPSLQKQDFTYYGQRFALLARTGRDGSHWQMPFRPYCTGLIFSAGLGQLARPSWYSSCWRKRTTTAPNGSRV